VVRPYKIRRGVPYFPAQICKVLATDGVLWVWIPERCHAMVKLLLLAFLSAAASFAAPVAAQQTSIDSAEAASGARQKLVIQVSDNDPVKWNLALNNARNVQSELGKENVDIEIVAYGPGLNMVLAESVAANRVNTALGENVSVVACDNTMHSMKLGEADLMGGIRHVKAGVVHLMQRQRAGWAYIRP